MNPPRQRLRVIRSRVGEWLARLRRRERETDAVAWYPEGDELVLRVPLAGFAADEIELAVAMDHVVIDARADHLRSFDGDGELRAQADLHVLLPLPEAVDTERAVARLRGGVLTIRAPRLRGDSGARRIPVKS